MKVARIHRLLCALLIALTTPTAGTLTLAAKDAGPRRVILMIADGAGYTTWEAAAYYQGNRGKQFFNQPGWSAIAVSTFALRDTREIAVAPEFGLTQHPGLIYDPEEAWDTTPIEGASGGYPYHFAGYRWLRHAPDSACTATALVAGRKSYVGSINMDGDGQRLEGTLAQLAHDAGMRVGTISSVPFNHATPAAAGGAHNADRGNYCELAWEMLTSPTLDVIAGAGNPDFDNNGKPIKKEEERIHRDVGDRRIWDALTGRASIKVGDAVCVPATNGEAHDDDVEAHRATREELDALNRWVLKQGKQETEALRKGKSPERLLMVPQVGRMGYYGGGPADPHQPKTVTIGGTLQQQRGSRANPKYTAPGDDPLVSTVPSLETLTLAALNSLDDEEHGFFLHVEGGAVDWAMHANQMGRTIEEMIDFEQAVLAAIAWVEANGGWDRTLLIVTSDHDHLLAGPQSDTIPFHPLVDNGPGKLPSYRWLWHGHSNHLVPAYARGVGVERLGGLVRGQDPFRGDYVDQVDLYSLMRAALLAE